MRYIWIFLFLHTFLSANSVLKIQKEDNFYNIGKHLEYCIDKDEIYNIDSIQKQEFKDYNKSIANFGFLQPTYWFKLRFVYDESMLKKDWLFRIDNTLLNYVDLYVLDENSKVISHKKSGNLRREQSLKLHENMLLFDMPNNHKGVLTLYLRVKTSGSLFIPIHFVSYKANLKDTHTMQLLYGAYYGVLFMLILYNFITFLYTREKMYILYVTFIVSYALWQLSFDGLGAVYFWSDNYWLIKNGTVLFIYTSTFALLLFSQTLLKAKENIPRLNRFLLDPLKYITIVGIIASVFLPYKYTIVFGALLAISVPATLFIGGIIVLKKDYYSIRLFVLGWGIFLVTTIVFSLSKFDLVPGFLIMKYGQQIGSIIDMILLSGALAERFKRLEDEYKAKLKNYNTDLKTKVKDALEQERKTDKMLIEQSRLASMGEMIEQIAHQWRQPLNNIALLNQDLYFKKELQTLSDTEFYKIHEQIDTNLQYMSNTIDDFRNYYKSDKKEEIYSLSSAVDVVLKITETTFKHSKIKILLDIDNTIMVKNVKNELYQVILNILNNAKDAILLNHIKDGQIKIIIRGDNGDACIDIIDNAGGVPKDIISKIFDPYFTTKFSNQGTGIGLYMAKMIVEKNMSGKLSVENIDNGACFCIKLPLIKEGDDIDVKS
jgi:signal transduction histidine kinase